MNARCVILAHAISTMATYGEHVYECPNRGGRTFHFHGDDPRGPYRLLVRGRPCEHRHKTVAAAVTCSERSHAQYVRD